MARRHIITLLALIMPLAFVVPAQAASVGINPPSAPVTVTPTELTLTAAFNVVSVTPPGQVNLRLIVTNIGALIATNVAIDNLLPIEFSYLNGQPTELKNLGNLSPGESISKTYAVSISADVKTNRYVNEAIASATNADSVEAIAGLDVANGKVLGATDSNSGSLASTGSSSLVIVLLGFLLIGGGVRQIRRQLE